MYRGIITKLPVVLCFLISIVFAGCSSQKTPESPALVIIGDEVLRVDDLKASIPEELYGTLTKVDLEEYVDRWIESQILYQKGLELGLANNPDIRKRVKEFEIRLIGSAFLDSALETTNMVTKEEIRRYYEENKDIFVRHKDEIHLQHILLQDKKTADAEYRALRRKRADFDSLMLHYNSELPESDRDLGYVSEDEVVETIWKKVRNYKVGAIVPPLKTVFGYHIFKIVDKQAEGSIKPLADVEMEIDARLKQDKLEEKYNAMLTQLKSTVKVETRFDLLNRIPMDSLLSKTNGGIAQSK